LRTDPPNVLSHLNIYMTALISSACLKDVGRHRKKPSPVAKLSFSINKAFDAFCQFSYIIKEENVME